MGAKELKQFVWRAVNKAHHNSKSDLLDPLILDDEPASENGGEARTSLIHYLQLLWQGRRLLTRVVAYGFLAALLIALLAPRKYESTARLMPPDSRPSATGLAALLSSSRDGGMIPLAGDLFGLKTTSALFVGVLRSRTVQDRIIEHFDLRRRYRLLPFGTPRIENVRAELADNTTISEDRKSGIITISVRDKEPAVAKAMAQAYVRELNRLVAEVSTSEARRERTFLEERLKAVKQELDKAAGEFSQFASRNVTLDIKEQTRAMVEAAASLQAQLIVAETELQGLRQMYTDENVRVRSAKARIRELRGQIDKIGGGDLAPNAASNDETTHYPSIRKLPLLGVEYANHYRRTRIAEMAYELLTRQYELARVQEAKEIPTVNVLDEPVVPEKPVRSRMLIAAFGTILALAGGIAWILGSSRWDEIDATHPGKVLASEVWQELRGQRQRLFSRNGSKANGAGSHVVDEVRSPDTVKAASGEHGNGKTI